MKKIVLSFVLISLYSAHIYAQKSAANFSGAPLSQSGGVPSPASLKQQHRQQKRQQQLRQQQKKDQRDDQQRQQQLRDPHLRDQEQLRKQNGFLIALPDDYDTPTQLSTQPNQSPRSSVVSVKKPKPPVAPKPGKPAIDKKSDTSGNSSLLLPYEENIPTTSNKSSILLSDDFDTSTRSNESSVLLPYDFDTVPANKSPRSSVISVKKPKPPVAPRPDKQKPAQLNKSALLLPYKAETPTPNQSSVESNFLLPADYDTPSRSNSPAVLLPYEGKASVSKVVKKVPPPVAPKPAKPQVVDPRAEWSHRPDVTFDAEGVPHLPGNILIAVDE